MLAPNLKRQKKQTVSQLTMATGLDSACRQIMVTSFKNGKVSINDTHYKGWLKFIQPTHPHQLSNLP